MCLLKVWSISSLAYGNHDGVLAGESGLQHDDTRAGEVDDLEQEAAEHVCLTVKMPAAADAYFIELQDVSFAVADVHCIELQDVSCAVALHLSLFSVCMEQHIHEDCPRWVLHQQSPAVLHALAMREHVTPNICCFFYWEKKVFSKTRDV